MHLRGIVSTVGIDSLSRAPGISCKHLKTLGQWLDPRTPVWRKYLDPDSKGIQGNPREIWKWICLKLTWHLNRKRLSLLFGWPSLRHGPCTSLSKRLDCHKWPQEKRFWSIVEIICKRNYSLTRFILQSILEDHFKVAGIPADMNKRMATKSKKIDTAIRQPQTTTFPASCQSTHRVLFAFCHRFHAWSQI